VVLRRRRLRSLWISSCARANRSAQFIPERCFETALNIVKPVWDLLRTYKRRELNNCRRAGYVHTWKSSNLVFTNDVVWIYVVTQFIRYVQFLLFLYFAFAVFKGSFKTIVSLTLIITIFCSAFFWGLLQQHIYRSSSLSQSSSFSSGSLKAFHKAWESSGWVVCHLRKLMDWSAVVVKAV